MNQRYLKNDTTQAHTFKPLNVPFIVGDCSKKNLHKIEKINVRTSLTKLKDLEF